MRGPRSHQAAGEEGRRREGRAGALGRRAGHERGRVEEGARRRERGGGGQGRRRGGRRPPRVAAGDHAEVGQVAQVAEVGPEGVPRVGPSVVADVGSSRREAGVPGRLLGPLGRGRRRGRAAVVPEALLPAAVVLLLARHVRQPLDLRRRSHGYNDSNNVIIIINKYDDNNDNNSALNNRHNNY